MENVIAMAGEAATQAPQGDFTQILFPILIIGFLFYFMILKPQKRDQQRVQDMRSAIKKGDRVRSIGGIYGTVTAVDTTRNIVTVQVDKNVKLDFDRDAIATVIRKEEAAAEAPASAEPAALEGAK